MDFQQALSYLDSHINLEATNLGRRDVPTLDRIRALSHLMGDPHLAYPVIHVTGTNGKGSTTRIISSILGAMGLSTGSYTSPHLESVTERLAWNGRPVPEDEMAEVLSALADLEDLMDARAHWFDLLTAAAFRYFADQAVDVGVFEVGLGGTWDATNIVQSQVAVITNIDLDHVEVLGPTRADIARDKAGIAKPGSVLVVGETDPQLAPIFEQAGAAALWQRGRDFDVTSSTPAVGGRVFGLRTPGSSYQDLYLPLHGHHQVQNAACAVAAVEAFFGGPIPEDVLAEGLAQSRSPGRLEVVGRRPLVLLDGAHNPAGAAAAATALDEEFSSARSRLLVVGLLSKKSPVEMLEAMGAPQARLLVATRAASPRALDPEELAAAARELGVQAQVEPDVGRAVRRAIEQAAEDDLVLVTGTLYIVGSARASLLHEPA
jgi:dihydrofolate synthase/folylpolyglutamate synthase